MNWLALAEERCPKCGSKLCELGLLDTHRNCSADHCSFKIGIDKFASIATSERKKVDRQYQTESEDNLSRLNNL